MVAIDNEIAGLVRRSAEANALLMRGDATRYSAMMGYTDDFLLFSPFGGTPSRGGDYTPERVAAMGRFFRNGTLTQELVQAWGTTDMVVLAVIERAHVEVGGLPAQDWALRVSLVFRREEEGGGGWRLVHRHADPLVAGIGLQQAAVLGRGEPQSVFASATS
jgi:ketosteroid isomerase-like protein